MTLRTTTRAAVLSAALAGSLSLAACGASNEGGGTTNSGSSADQLSGDLVGAGSSAQQAAMQAWQAGFTSDQPGVNVSYDPVGSGGGREQFLAGGVDFAGSDAALSDEELTAAEERCGASGVFELPNYISAIAVVYNLDGVDDLERPGDRGRQPGRAAAQHRHHAGAPRRQVRDDEELHRLPRQGRR
jgi:phosphate transport system substrate-binding protein